MKKSHLMPVFGISLFLWLLLNIDIHSVLRTLSGADPLLMCISLLLVIPIVVIKSEKWKVIIKSYGIDYPLKKTVRAWVLGFSLSIVTPGRIGDFSRAFILKTDEKVTLGKSLATVILDRIIDIAVLFCLAIVGIMAIALGPTQLDGILLTVMASFFGFLGLVFLLTKKSMIRPMLKPLTEKVIPEKHKKAASGVFHDFYVGISETGRGRILASLSLSVVSWALAIIQAVLILESFGVHVSALFIFSVLPIVTLLDTLPISVSGIGTRDMALIYFLSLVSVSSEVAISLSLSILFFDYILIALLGLIIWARNPVKLR
jgi:hypothetical protein